MNFGTELFLFIVRDEIFINRLVTFRLAQLYCVNLISFRDFYAGQANTRGRIVQQTKRPLGSTVLLNVQSPVSVFVDTNTGGGGGNISRISLHRFEADGIKFTAKLL